MIKNWKLLPVGPFSKYFKIKFNIVFAVLTCHFAFSQEREMVKVNISTDKEYQTIHNFAASDAWAAQFTGLWPDDKKNLMADWLFSLENNTDGSPRGIGLSAWRFNIGAGSEAQGEESGIKDPWRRAEGFLQDNANYDWHQQAGQQWFLQAAKERGVNQFIAFVNSPPIQMTRNNKAHSKDGLAANLSYDRYVDYGVFLANFLHHFRDSLAIDFDYISPFNEPQWEWKGGQEGSPWNNDELANATRVIDSIFVTANLNSKIEITEAGQIDYLTGEKEKYHNRSNQIETFFNPVSPNYLGNLRSVALKIAAHSYFTTWDISKLKKERERIAKKLEEYPSLEYWMSEYCILENNEEIKGKGRDLGMKTALYVARLIHADLTIANASAWHWWLAMSPYDFKDGLIYVDKETNDRDFYDSKLLWALGNYSRFIRPGAKRVSVAYDNYNTEENLKNGVLLSAYKNTDDSLVLVAINQSDAVTDIKLNVPLPPNTKIERYVTSESHNLSKIPNGQFGKGKIQVLGKSLTTFVFNVGE
ncbi:glycoside hydrolase [Arenibacter sp. ARW7G5Y1]|uniref:glycoside hydrolase n=1 Tax=Arenibacter sp. ARW7G5Y1 TaxID=2135619 RepID=UPI000D752B40|nr:glycoside hydrolase [Arenibacter sp. ARW7G5Y1]PXX31806.1 O-glycosyl hydrolase [Arenibacter sp. ARW7G5Y1]